MSFPVERAGAKNPLGSLMKGRPATVVARREGRST